MSSVLPLRMLRVFERPQYMVLRIQSFLIDGVYFCSVLCLPCHSFLTILGWFFSFFLRCASFHSERHCGTVSFCIGWFLASIFLERRFCVLVALFFANASVFGRGASGKCKNKKCLNPKTNERRQSIHGYNGYCTSCAKDF